MAHHTSFPARLLPRENCSICPVVPFREKKISSARRLLSAALLERWPQVCRAKIAFTVESFRFHNKKFDEMRCKLDSTEIPRSFEKYLVPP